MKTALLITLKDDVIVSASSATTGGHKSLDYIPGSLLLGAAAAKIYKTIEHPKQAWTLFHSGKISFGNAYIISSTGEPTFPSPLSFHYYKGNEPDTEHPLSADNIFRPVIDQRDPARQPKQLRGSYLTASGKQVSVKKAATMKTAINSTTGRAADSQLFGYEALCSDQQFLAIIECTDDVDTNLFSKLIKALEGPARIGRSRSAQYGRIEIKNLGDKDYLPSITTPEGTTELTLWCLSDLALIDEKTLQPTLQPAPQHFGLNSGELDISRSYIRSRSYSPYNSYRNAFDQQRQVITMGSIIHFTKLDPPLTSEQIKSLQRPQGCFTENGLGSIVPNANICIQSPLAFNDHFKIDIASSLEKVSDEESALIQWLRAQTPTASSAVSQQWLTAKLNQIQRHYVTARQLNAIDPKHPIGPSASQWGEVYQTARDLRTQPNSLCKALFLGEKEAICRERAGSEHSWGLAISPNKTFVQWLFTELIPEWGLSNEHKLIKTEDAQGDTPKLDEHFCEQVALLAAEMRKPRGEKISMASTIQPQEGS